MFRKMDDREPKGGGKMGRAAKGSAAIMKQRKDKRGRKMRRKGRK